jgi:hypothetical protein
LLNNSVTFVGGKFGSIADTEGRGGNDFDLELFFVDLGHAQHFLKDHEISINQPMLLLLDSADEPLSLLRDTRDDALLGLLPVLVEHGKLVAVVHKAEPSGAECARVDKGAALAADGPVDLLEEGLVVALGEADHLEAVGQVRG